MYNIMQTKCFVYNIESLFYQKGHYVIRSSTRAQLTPQIFFEKLAKSQQAIRNSEKG